MFDEIQLHQSNIRNKILSRSTVVDCHTNICPIRTITNVKAIHLHQNNLKSHWILWYILRKKILIELTIQKKCVNDAGLMVMSAWVYKFTIIFSLDYDQTYAYFDSHKACLSRLWISSKKSTLTVTILEYASMFSIKFLLYYERCECFGT